MPYIPYKTGYHSSETTFKIHLLFYQLLLRVTFFFFKLTGFCKNFVQKTFHEEDNLKKLKIVYKIAYIYREIIMNQ